MVYLSELSIMSTIPKCIGIGTAILKIVTSGDNLLFPWFYLQRYRAPKDKRKLHKYQKSLFYMMLHISNTYLVLKDLIAEY